jgi:biopolymer transport protein ExbD
MKHTNIRRRMLISVLSIAATALLAPIPSHAQEMQRGVSVQMPVTRNATSVPDADHNDAWVVTVTADGSLYFGADPMTREDLADWMKTHPRNREARLYIKADARAPFASVKAALGSARSSNFEDVVLLTSQPGSHVPATIVPPKGIAVLLAGSGSGGAIQVRLSSSAQGSMLNVNDQHVPWSELEGTLKGLVHSGAQFVQVEANGALPFADVIRVIDEARAAGASVALPIYHSI